MDNTLMNLMNEDLKNKPNIQQEAEPVIEKADTVTSENKTEQVESDKTPNVSLETKGSVEDFTQTDSTNKTADTVITEKNNLNNSDGTTTSDVPVKKTNSFASEKVAKYNDFVEKTGKDDWKEFEFLTTPSKDLDKKELLRKYYSEQEGMSEKEIAFAMSELEVTESNNDDDFSDGVDEKEILRREAKLESELRKASKWHDENLQNFESNNVEQLVEKKYTYDEILKEAIEQQKNILTYNREKVYQELPKLNEIELSYQGNEQLGIDAVNVKYIPDAKFIENARTVSEDVNVLIKSFFNDKDQLINPKGFIETVTKAYAPTSTAVTNFLIEQAVLNDRAKRDKLRRNVGADIVQTVVGDSNEAAEAFKKDYEKRTSTPFK